MLKYNVKSCKLSDIKVISLTKKTIINNSTPQRFMCHTPIREINWSVMINPKSMGIKSPNFFMDGINKIGNDVNTKTMTMAVVMDMSFGRMSCAILECYCLIASIGSSCEAL